MLWGSRRKRKTSRSAQLQPKQTIIGSLGTQKLNSKHHGKGSIEGGFPPAITQHHEKEIILKLKNLLK